MKLFVGRIPNGATPEDLKNHFAEFGEVSDAYIPTPFRGFGFITFASSAEGRLAQRITHKMKVKYHISIFSSMYCPLLAMF